MSNKTKVVTARVSNEIAERLEQMAEGTTKSEVVERAIKAYADINTICIWGNIEANECCRQIEEMFKEGQIEIKEGRIVVNDRRTESKDM